MSSTVKSSNVAENAVAKKTKSAKAGKSQESTSLFPLTLRIRAFDDSMKNAKNSMSDALAKIVAERIANISDELDLISEHFNVKQLSDKHVTYAWAIVEKTPVAAPKKAQKADKKKSKQAGGGYTESQPAEFYGGPQASTNYFQHNAIAKFETDMTVTDKFTRPEMPVKELVMNGGNAEAKKNGIFETEAIQSAFNVLSAKKSFKVTSAGMKEVYGKVNAFAEESLKAMVAKKQPAAVKKVKQTVVGEN